MITLDINIKLTARMTQTEKPTSTIRRHLTYQKAGIDELPFAQYWNLMVKAQSQAIEHTTYRDARIVLRIVFQALVQEELLSDLPDHSS